MPNLVRRVFQGCLVVAFGGALLHAVPARAVAADDTAELRARIDPAIARVRQALVRIRVVST